jgi:3-(3-hydroxy-phenyl)propionate hydroxylase
MGDRRSGALAPSDGARPDLASVLSLPTAEVIEYLDRVVVCGAGPVGLCLALCLADSGVPVTVIDAKPGLIDDSRVTTLHPPSLELLDELGVVSRVIERGIAAPTTQFRDRHSGPVANFDLRVLSDVTRYPFRLELTRHDLTDVLRAEIDRGVESGEFDVELRFSHRVAGVRRVDDPNGFEHLVVDTDSGVIEMRSPWIAVACPAAGDAVRESLGIEMAGETYPDHILGVSVQEDLAQHIEGLGHVNYVTDPDEWLVILHTPASWRILLPVREAAACDGEAVQAMLSRVSDLGRPWQIVGQTLYTTDRRVAERFRDGRVLLVGDAAHQSSPVGGMAMSAGIADAVSCGRRLTEVWLRRADATILDEYDELRREVAAERLQAESHASWTTLREPDADRRSQILAELRDAAQDLQLHRERMHRSSLLDLASAGL